MERWLIGLASLVLALAIPTPLSSGECAPFHVTGYTLTGTMANGESNAGLEWSVAAAHGRIPFGATAQVSGVGNFRVADRGLLGPYDLDIYVGPGAAAAYALTGTYDVCWW